METQILILGCILPCTAAELAKLPTKVLNTANQRFAQLLVLTYHVDGFWSKLPTLLSDTASVEGNIMLLLCCL